MGLKYATITGVARDDLPDGGAWLYAETVRAIKALNPSTGVELLAPDFNGEPDLLREVFESRPEVFATTSRKPSRGSSSGSGRPSVTSAASTSSPPPATSVTVTQEQPDDPGHGRDHRRGTALTDLHDAGCDIVTHHPVPAPVGPASSGRALGAPG